MQRPILWILLLLLLAPSLQAAPLDRQREARLAEQLTRPPATGEAVWLETAGQPFLTLYRAPATPKPLGGVILVPGPDAHADWPQAIGPLRRGLAQRGWATLAVQPPVFASGATPDGEDLAAWLKEAGVRLAAAAEHLSGQKIAPIAVVGYGLGANAVLGYATDAGQGDSRIKALVAIDLEGTATLPAALQPIAVLKTLKLPLFDVSSGPVDALVRPAAHERRRAMAENGANPAYTQFELPGAEAALRGQDPLLVQRVHSWFRKMLAERKTKSR